MVEETLETKIEVHIDITRLKEFIGLLDTMVKSVASSEKAINKRLTKIGQSVARSLIAQSVGDTQQGQSTQGFKRQFEGLQKSLEPLKQQVQEALGSFVQPSKTAEQAVNGILVKQKEMAMQSANMKKQLQETGIARMTKQTRSFSDVLNLSFENWKMLNKEGVRFQTMSARLGNSFRQLAHGMRGFRMEMLGVLFFGMAIQRLFTSMLRPTLELFGVFDLWRVMLQILFLPVVAALFPFFIRLIELFLELSPEVQMAIGVFAVLGVIFGAILNIIGQLGLGIGSVVIAFKGIFGVSGIASTLSKIGVAFKNIFSILKVGGIILSIFAVLWITNFGRIQEFTKNTLGIIFSTIKSQFGDVINLFKTFFTIIIKIVSGDIEVLPKLFKKAFILILSILAKSVTLSFSILGNLLTFAVNIFVDMFKFFSNVGGLIAKVIIAPFIFAQSAVSIIFRDLLNTVGGYINSLIDKFVKVADLIGLPTDFIENLKFKPIEEGITIMDKFKQSMSELKGFDGLTDFFDNLGGTVDFIKPDQVQAILDNITDKAKLKIDEIDFGDLDTTDITAPEIDTTLPGSSLDSSGTGTKNNINVTQNLDINVSNTEEMIRLINDNNKSLVDDIKRLTNVSG